MFGSTQVRTLTGSSPLRTLSKRIAAVSEALEVPFQSRRLARPDTYPPFNYINQLEVFPDLRRVLNAAAELCDLDVSWEERAAETAGIFTLEAVGSSPADQTVSVVEWKVAEGDAVAQQLQVGAEGPGVGPAAERQVVLDDRRTIAVAERKTAG